MPRCIRLSQKIMTLDDLNFFVTSLLYARNRLHDGLNFISAGDLSDISLGDLALILLHP